MRELVLIAHNLRSTHNVGSLFRTCEGLGVGKIWLTGYSPYPLSDQDDRLPHLARKISSQIDKTALGAVKTLPWEHEDDIFTVFTHLENQGFTIAALEQAEDSVKLPDFHSPNKLALVVGREREGLETEVLKRCQITLEIPMSGHKESFNVVQAAAMALYHCRYVA